MRIDREELKSLTVDQLKERIEEQRREQLSLKLNALTTHIKDYSQFKKVRKNIARLLTYLNQKMKES